MDQPNRDGSTGKMQLRAATRASRFALLVGVALALLGGQATAAGLYRCDSKDAVRQRGNGLLERDTVADWWRENKYKTIIVDVTTGAIQFHDAV